MSIFDNVCGQLQHIVNKRIDNAIRNYIKEYHNNVIDFDRFEIIYQDDAMKQGYCVYMKDHWDNSTKLIERINYNELIDMGVQ